LVSYREIFESLYATYGILRQDLFRSLFTCSNLYTAVYFNKSQSLECSTVRIHKLSSKSENKVTLVIVSFFYDDDQAMWFDSVSISSRTDLDFSYDLYGVQYFLIPTEVYNYPELLLLFNIPPLTIDTGIEKIASI
jgi:hypothetical protein